MSTIAIVSDCWGQAMGRMTLRTQSLIPGAQVVPFECDSIWAARGNIVDAIDAGAEVVLCNSAPREEVRKENGDGICYTRFGGALVVATFDTLAMLAKFSPGLVAWEVDIESFMIEFGKTSRGCFSFRGLEVIPLIAKVLEDGRDLTGMSRERSVAKPKKEAVWLVDTIAGVPYNLKLSLLRREVRGFERGKAAMVQVGGVMRPMLCYERLTHIPRGEIGLYEGSSGYGEERFLEIAMMGSSAANRLEVKCSGLTVSVSI